MSILKKNITITPEEFLEGELYSETKHEYVAGHIYAMVGVSEAHNRISIRLTLALDQHLRGTPCRVFMAEMKAKVTEDIFFYPDVMVTCDRSDNHEYYKTAPVLIIEVLSPATEKRDIGEKRMAYQMMESLKEYVLVAQDKLEMRIYRRTQKGWDEEIYSRGDRVRFESVGLDFPIEAIYEDVRST